ncbi:hypothetical protein BJ741DRAFT_613633 [Chytriomyces cf. hyalinus JEL632]|nr:hypothetical protein BJ741DRAFT_613633 [Chytriomyces cf. hyalinus JEL632]
MQIDDESGVQAHVALLALFAYGAYLVKNVWGATPAFAPVAVFVLASVDMAVNRRKYSVERAEVEEAEDETDADKLVQEESSVQEEEVDQFYDADEPIETRLMEPVEQHAPAAAAAVAAAAVVPAAVATTGLKVADYADLIECVRIISNWNPAQISVSASQMWTLKYGLLTMSEVAFKQTKNATAAEKLCLEHLPRTIANIQFIANHLENSSNSQSKQQQRSTMDDEKDAEFVNTVLRRMIQTLVRYHDLDSAAAELNWDGSFYVFESVGVAQSTMDAMLQLVGGKVEEAKTQLTQLASDWDNQSSDATTARNRDSLQTLTEDDESHEGEWESTDAYLIYVHDLDAFAPVQNTCPEDSKRVRTAIAQMPSMGLVPGDRFVILCGWRDATQSTMQPKSNFMPAPSSMQRTSNNNNYKSNRSLAAKPSIPAFENNASSGFSAICHARIESVQDLPPTACRVTVSILQERENVAFSFSPGVSGVDVSKLILENRVKDAFTYGSVRVGSEIVDALF